MPVLNLRAMTGYPSSNGLHPTGAKSQILKNWQLLPVEPPTGFITHRAPSRQHARPGNTGFSGIFPMSERRRAQGGAPTP